MMSMEALVKVKVMPPASINLKALQRRTDLLFMICTTAMISQNYATFLFLLHPIRHFFYCLSDVLGGKFYKFSEDSPVVNIMNGRSFKTSFISTRLKEFNFERFFTTYIFRIL